MTKKIIVELIGDGTEGNPFRPNLPPGTEFIDLTNRAGADCDTGDGIVVEVTNEQLTDNETIKATIPPDVLSGGIDSIRDHLKKKPKKPKNKNVETQIDEMTAWVLTHSSQSLE